MSAQCSLEKLSGKIDRLRLSLSVSTECVRINQNLVSENFSSLVVIEAVLTKICGVCYKYCASFWINIGRAYLTFCSWWSFAEKL
jgi:hypothetical protein